LIIEDIHWLDLSSLDLLDFLLPVIREARISILMTARAEMAGPHRSLLSKAERICGERYLQIKFSGLTDEIAWRSFGKCWTYRPCHAAWVECCVPMRVILFLWRKLYAI